MAQSGSESTLIDCFMKSQETCRNARRGFSEWTPTGLRKSSMIPRKSAQLTQQASTGNNAKSQLAPLAHCVRFDRVSASREEVNCMSSGNTERRVSRSVFMAVLLVALLLLATQVAGAQCVANPTRETAVGLKNSSSHFLTFFIDGENKGGIPSGDRSADFVVTPGQHTLRAEAVINGETVSASRTTDIPAGYVCTWTVTDPLPTKLGKREQR